MSTILLSHLCALFALFFVTLSEDTYLNLFDIFVLDLLLCLPTIMLAKLPPLDPLPSSEDESLHQSSISIDRAQEKDRKTSPSSDLCLLKALAVHRSETELARSSAECNFHPQAKPEDPYH